MSKITVTVERAAKSADELAFLCAIVDNPSDDLPRLVYADWLEEKGDPRGPLLRGFVEACNSKKRLPGIGKLSPVWADVTGLTFLRAIAKSDLLDLRHELMGLARPALKLKPCEANFENPPPPPDALGTTRLGGDPDLPTGTSYPTAADGVPLHFLGQFDLSDFRGTVAGRAFPDAGMMSIFRPQSDGKNCYPTDQDCPRLVHFSPAGSRFTRLPRPSGLMDRPAPYRPGLRLVETLRLPADPTGWPGVSLSYEQFSAFDRVHPTCLGGTDYILLGHVTHGNVGEEPLKDRPDWVQLVLVPYFEGPDYGISDMSLSYQLPAADLKAGNFTRLEATFG